MTETEKLGTVIVAAVRTAQAPLLEEIGRLKATVAILEARPMFTAELSQSMAESAMALVQRIEVLETRPAVPGPQGEPGQPADLSEIRAMKEQLIGFGAQLAEHSSVPTPDDITAAVQRGVMEAMAQIPMPKDGKDGTSVTVDELKPFIVQTVDAEVFRSVNAIPPAKDGAPGRSIDPVEVEAMIATHVTKAVAALPVPKDGKDGQNLTPADVVPLVAAEVTKAVATLPPAKDGVGVVGALIDRDGHLVVTLSDGLTKDVGPVVGRDVDMGVIAKQIQDELAKWPRPKDGINGKDGFGFDDMDLDVDEAGSCILRFTRGEQVRTFNLPVPRYCGVYKAGQMYEKGQAVTWAGSLWIAQRPTADKPGDGPTGWQLAVKAGRDGKEGPKGEPGVNGKDGRAGRDLTQMGSDGRKWS